MGPVTFSAVARGVLPATPASDNAHWLQPRTGIDEEISVGGRFVGAAGVDRATFLGSVPPSGCHPKNVRRLEPSLRIQWRPGVATWPRRPQEPEAAPGNRDPNQFRSSMQVLGFPPQDDSKRPHQPPPVLQASRRVEECGLSGLEGLLDSVLVAQDRSCVVGHDFRVEH